MNKRITKLNRLCKHMRFGALTEDYWKAYNEYMKEMYNRFVYRDTDAIYVKEGEEVNGKE